MKFNEFRHRMMATNTRFKVINFDNNESVYASKVEEKKTHLYYIEFDADTKEKDIEFMRSVDRKDVMNVGIEDGIMVIWVW